MPLRNMMRQRFSPVRQAYFWQIVRYAIAGLALTAMMSAIYLAIVNFTIILPAIAVTLATVLTAVAGYFVHGSFSFRGFGDRQNAGRRFLRFLVTTGVGYVLNLGFVIVMTDILHLPTWLPTVAFCTVTPMVAFLLCRSWVFG